MSSNKRRRVVILVAIPSTAVLVGAILVLSANVRADEASLAGKWRLSSLVDSAATTFSYPATDDQAVYYEWDTTANTITVSVDLGAPAENASWGSQVYPYTELANGNYKVEGAGGFAVEFSCTVAGTTLTMTWVGTNGDWSDPDRPTGIPVPPFQTVTLVR